MSTASDSAGTALIVYDQITDPAAFIDKLGDAIFKSGMFGCESAPQGRVLALECAARKAPPLMLAERYHLIKGKLSMKADAMLGDFISKAGGTHQVVERSEVRAAVELSRNGQKRVFALTWEQALEEPFVYVGREDQVAEMLVSGKREKLKLKAKYATPRGRMQMMWARVISDGVRTMAPEIVAGCYTPEEISDFDYVQAGRSRKEKTAAAASDDAGEDVMDVEVEAAPFDGATNQGEPAGGTTREATPTIAADSLAEAEAIAQADGGKTTTLIATEEQLDAAVHSQVVTQAQQAQQVQQAPAPTTGQATTQQIERVKALVVELQVNRERLVAMLARVGAAKVSDLSAAHCQALIAVLEAQKAKLAAGKN